MAWCLVAMLLGVCVCRADQLAFTLTYDGPGFTNGAPVPDPYPGIAGAIVTHYGRSQNDVEFQDVSFSSGDSPGVRYGNLTNVSVGPAGRPSDFGLVDPAWSVISITPNYPGTFIRLTSLDIASLDDNNVDEFITGIVVVDSHFNIYWSRFGLSVEGDVNSATNTHIVFTNTSGVPVEGPMDQSLIIYWEARNGRVAVDNVKFELVGPIPTVLAKADYYSVKVEGNLAVTAPGVLGNDLLREDTGPLSAALGTVPTKGVFNLSTNGAFNYTPTGDPGMDSFTYQAIDSSSNFNTGITLISVLPPGALFVDDFARPGGMTEIAPWQINRLASTTPSVDAGDWAISNGALHASSPLNSAAFVYMNESWANYSVEVKSSLPTNGYGWTIGGRLNAARGKYYGVFLLPYGTGGSWILRLIKYTGWDQWSGTTMNFQGDIPVSGVGTTNLHSLKMTFHGNRILVHFDGSTKIDVTDDNWEGPVYSSGGINIGMYTGTNAYTLSVDEVIVRQTPMANDLMVQLLDGVSTNLVLQGSVGEGVKSFVTLSGPTNGTLSLLDTNTGAVTYTPNPNYNGPDHFNFAVNDGSLSATGAVNITVSPVNSSPVATGFLAVTPEDTVASLLLLGSDADGPVLFSILAGPTNGMLSGLEVNSGTVNYAPATNYHGPDSFTFEVSDGVLTATGLVSVTVTPVNDLPSVTNLIAQTPEDTGIDLTLLGGDVESLVTFAILTSPVNGVLAGFDPNTGKVHYAPATNYNGPDAFMFAVSDGSQMTTGLVSVTVTPVNDLPKVTNLIAQTPEDTGIDLTLLGGDVESLVTFAILTSPVNGALANFDPDTGTVRYAPATNYNGPDAFMFTVSDGSQMATGLVSVTVTPVNDLPSVTNLIAQTPEDTGIDLTLLGGDVESLVTFAILTSPVNGALANFDPDTGAVRYAPATNYNGPDAFMFAVSDGSQMATGLVSVTVTPVNDPPKASDMIVEILEGTQANLALSGSDVEGPLSFAIASNPINGVLTNLNANTGVVKYIPATNYHGPDAFTFTVSDGTLLATGLVSVAVVPPFIGFHGGVEVAGNIALAPDAYRSLAAYDLKAGTNLSHLWTHIDAGWARRVVVRGQYAFVAGGPEGLIVIDLSDANLSVAEGQILTIGDCVDVVISENTAYVADVERGVVAVDVTYPLYPREISVVASSQMVTGLDIFSNHLYVAAGPSGLQIYDVSDPLNSVFVAGLATTGSASRVHFQASFAYVVCGDARLEIINVQNPQSPVLAGSYTTTGSIADLDVSDKFVFLANTNGTFAVLSVSNAASPLLLTNYAVSGGATGVRVVGNVAYLRDLAGRLVALELAGLAPIPPRLLRPVKDQTGLLGQNATFSVDVEGSPLLNYQWYKDGVSLAADSRIKGAKGPILQIQGLLETDAGVYSVTVTNVFGRAVSSNAVLTLLVPGTPLNEGTFRPEGYTAGLWTDGRYAYTATGDEGLQLFDISNPHFPVFGGSFDTDGEANMVEVLGDYAFVADGSAGVQIVSLNNYPIGYPVGALDTPGTALGINVIAGNVYVADGAAGLRIIDARDPTQPVETGAYDTLGTAHAVRTIGGLAFVADGAAGVQIINVANPTNLSLVGGFNTDGTAYRVEVVGSRAFVADGTNGLVVLDIGNPNSPTLLGHYPTAGPAMSLVIVDGMALVAEGAAGLEVVDISDSTNLFYIARSGDLGEALDVKLVGNTVTVACGTNGVRILSLLGIVPTVPEILSSSGDQYLLPGQSSTLQVTATGANPLRYQWFKNGRVMYAGPNTQGVISDTLQLTNLTLADSGDYSLVVWNAWNMANAGSVNLHVVPLGTPVPRTNYYNGTDLLDVHVSGQLGYVASRQGGLEVIDFRNVTNPIPIGSHPTFGFAQHLQMRGHLVYVAAWDSGLEIFDVAQPTNLVRIGRCDTPGFATGVAIADQLAYVADFTNGLQVIDVRNPSQPFLIGKIPTRGPALKVQVRSNKAYVATSGAGLELFDVSDPLGIVRLGWIDTPGEAVNVELTETHAFVSDYDQGLRIVDVSNPLVPAFVGEYLTQGDVFHAQVISNLAYIAKGTRGMDAVDASNPLFPHLALAGKAGATVHALRVSGKHAFLADRTRGFVVAEFLGTPPTPPQLFESPESANKVAGSTLVLSVAVRGTPPFSYQWYKDGVPLVSDDRVQGVSEPHLRVNHLVASDAGNYLAVVSNPQGVVTSALASVMILMESPLTAPAFVIHPTNQTALLGGAVTFQATVVGSNPLVLRWHLNGEPLFEGDRFSGVSSRTLVVTNIGLRQDGIYELRAWNAAGLAVSQPAALTFIGPLQDQINKSLPGSTVTLPAAVYEERLVITKNLTLSGAGPGATTLDALGRATPVTISNGAHVTLRGLTIRNGRSPANGQGGAIKNFGQLLLQNCVLTNNIAGTGGGIANLHIARVFSSIIANNQSTVAAGGVYNGVNATFEIKDSTIEGNVASLGGGVFNGGNLFATNCTLSANMALGIFETGLGYGGGVYSIGTGWVVNCTISGNRAVVPPLSLSGGAAGGLFVPIGAMELHSTTLAFNFASTTAGGVLAGPNSQLRARNTIFASNVAGGVASDVEGPLHSAGFNLVQAYGAAEIVGETTNNLLGLDPLLGTLQANGGTTHTHALRSGSPAIDTGACSEPSADQRGVVRPFDIPAAINIAGGCDIGAFEYTSGPPMVVSPGNLVTAEDVQLVCPFFADDAETPGGLTFAVTSDQQHLIRATNVVVGGVSGSRTLSIMPEANQSGIATLYILVTDADGFTNDISFDVVVQPVNDAPIITGFSNSIVEAPLAQYSFAFTISDADTPIEVISLQVDSSNPVVINPGSIAVDGNRMKRRLNLTHVPGEIGITTISVMASDGVTSTTNEFVLEVRAIQLSLANLAVEDKAYDGGMAATVSSYGMLVGLWPGHDVTLDTTAATAVFDSPNAGASKPVTVVGLALNGTDAPSYSITDQTATAAILPEVLIVTADDKIRAYGQTNPVFTLTYIGFVAGDDENVLEEKPTAETEATISSSAGNYAIAVVGGLDNNYHLVRVDGTLTITNVPPVILSLTGAGTGNTVIKWSAVSNQVYRLQYSDDLRSSHWFDRPPDITALGTTATATNVADSVMQRFYRVLLLP